MNNFVLFGSVAVSSVGRQTNHTDNFTKCFPLELCKLLYKTKKKCHVFSMWVEDERLLLYRYHIVT